MSIPFTPDFLSLLHKVLFYDSELTPSITRANAKYERATLLHKVRTVQKCRSSHIKERRNPNQYTERNRSSYNRLNCSRVLIYIKSQNHTRENENITGTQVVQTIRNREVQSWSYFSIFIWTTDHGLDFYEVNLVQLYGILY